MTENDGDRDSIIRGNDEPSKKSSTLGRVAVFSQKIAAQAEANGAKTTLTPLPNQKSNTSSPKNNMQGSLSKSKAT